MAGRRKKLRANEHAVLRLEAQTPDFPDRKIDLYVHVNPPGGTEILQSGTVEVTCSVASLRHLAASPDKVEALLGLGIKAWNGIGPAYGFGNLAIVQNARRLGRSRQAARRFPWDRSRRPRSVCVHPRWPIPAPISTATSTS